MKTLALLCLSLGMVPILCAQQPTAPPTTKPVLPPGPLLSKAPDFAQWTVTTKTEVTPTGARPSATPKTSRHHKAPPGPPTNQMASVIKTQSLRYEETVTGGGNKVQKWCVPDMQVTIEASGQPLVALKEGAKNSSAYTDYSKTDFMGFEWISPRNFTGVENVMGQECLVFKDKIKIEGGGDPSEPPPEVSAYINAATRLPVQLTLDDEVSTYQFGPAPQAMLTLPPEVESVVTQWRETMRQSDLMPAKP